MTVQPHRSKLRSGQAMLQQRGFTLIEMMISIVVTLIVTGGAMGFLVMQARMSTRSSDRSDLQRSARAGLSLMEDKIRMAGLGLPRHLAIQSFELETCGDVQTPRLVVASLDYVRQWTVQSTTGDYSAGGITLTSADPSPANVDDINIPANTWVFLFQNAVLDPGGNSGHGMAMLDAQRDSGSVSVSIGDTDFSVAQPQFNLAAGAAVNSTTAGRSTVMLLVDVAALGVDCTNPDHPYLYWDENGDSARRQPVASNVDTRPLEAANAALRAEAGDVVGLRFRFLLDSDGDGVGDDVNTDGEVTLDDFADTPIFDADSTVATHDDVMAIEMVVRLRSQELDTLGEYRIQDFVRVVQLPNINTKAGQYIFIGNGGI